MSTHTISGGFVCHFSLGSTRFFKVARAKTTEGLAVVKVFVIHDPSLPLSSHRARIEGMGDKINNFTELRSDFFRVTVPLIKERYYNMDK